MPATKNAMTRYALIDKLLANRNKAFSIQDITEYLEEHLPEYGQEPVSKRCVEKDLNYLVNESPFDVEIEEYWIDAPDKNGRPYRKRCIRYQDATFSIFKPKLSEDEKTVLATALDTLGSFDGLENFEWLNDLKHRLKLEEHEPIISISKNLISNSSLIARLFTVIRTKQVISLIYHTFSNSESRAVEISPYLLKEYNNRWYLIAGACDTGKLLTFPLDRIDDFTPALFAKYREPIEDVNEHYEEIIGVTFDEDAPLQEIIFWISDKSKDYVITKPIHGSQKTLKSEKDSYLRQVYPKLKNGKFFQIECRENYELIRELISFGPELLVLSPINIKNQILKNLDGSLQRYKSL